MVLFRQPPAAAPRGARSNRWISPRLWRISAAKHVTTNCANRSFTRRMFQTDCATGHQRGRPARLDPRRRWPLPLPCLAVRFPTVRQGMRRNWLRRNRLPKASAQPTVRKGFCFPPRAVRTSSEHFSSGRLSAPSSGCRPGFPSAL
jgi:hypothetical protein